MQGSVESDAVACPTLGLEGAGDAVLPEQPSGLARELASLEHRPVLEHDLRPGGEAKLTWTSGDEASLRIERIEEPTVFCFTWGIYGLPDGDPRRTYVEFTLEPTASGTRLTVVESGFAQLPEDDYRKAFSSNTEGWAMGSPRDALVTWRSSANATKYLSWWSSIAHSVALSRRAL